MALVVVKEMVVVKVMVVVMMTRIVTFFVFEIQTNNEADGKNDGDDYK